jgi:hypothetical protein
MIGMGAVAIIIESLKSMGKYGKFYISNQWIVQTVLLIMFGIAMKPLTDGIAEIAKKVDVSTDLTEKEKENITMIYRGLKIQELSSDVERLEEEGASAWQVGKKKLELWTQEAQLGLQIRKPTESSLFGFSLSNLLEKLIGSFRPLMKLYFLIMANLYYLVICIAYFFSIFKGGHFLKPLAKYTLFCSCFFVINLMEYIYFNFFISNTISNASLGSAIFDPATVLISFLMIFVYVRAMEVARDMFPLSGQDAFGPMVGQTLAATSLLLMSKAGIKQSTPPKPINSGGNSNASAPADITSR